MPLQNLEVTIVGAGPAGLMAAEVLATGGARVTIIEPIQLMPKAEMLEWQER